MPRMAVTFPKFMILLARSLALGILLLSGVALSAETSGEVSFEWDAIDGAEGYRLEISTTPDFKKLSQSFDLKEPRKDVKLRYDKKFYWRVAGKNFLGDLGDWSDAAEISVESPPKPVVIVEQAKPVTPPPPPKAKTVVRRMRPRYTGWLRAGMSGYYHLENISGDGYNVNNTGVPAGKLNLAGLLLADRFEFEGRFSYQKLAYAVQNSPLPELQNGKLSATYFAATGLMRGLFKVFGLPLSLGGSVKQRPILSTDLAETLKVDPLTSVSFLMGLSSYSKLSDPWYWKWEALAELSPVGDVSGAGLSLETTLGYTMGKFSPEITLGLNPFYYSTENIKSAFTCDISVGLQLRWNFSFGARVPVTPARPVEAISPPTQTTTPEPTAPTFGPAPGG